MAQITGFFHAGVTVKDLDVSLPFYRDALGLEIAFERVIGADYLRTVLALPLTEIKIVYLHIPGGGYVELLEYQGLERFPANSRPCDFGAGHLCLYVDDIDELVAGAQSMGYSGRSDGPVDITEGPNKGARSIYLLDPDGYAVELLQKPPAA